MLTPGEMGQVSVYSAVIWVFGMRFLRWANSPPRKDYDADYRALMEVQGHASYRNRDVTYTDEHEAGFVA